MTCAADVNGALSAIVRVVGELSVFDWVLIALALLALGWGWLYAASFARLGSIEIGDLAADGDDLKPQEMKAELRRRLGERGLLPPSGVPGGSPTKEDISNAVADAPVPQAGFLGALIKIIPTPPTSTSFTVTGTLSSSLESEHGPLALLYQLVTKGPRVSVTLGRTTGAHWGEVIDQAGRDIYREIAAAAPGIYPRWSRWCSSEALHAFARGLEAEADGTPACAFDAEARDAEQAMASYREAAELDRENMIVRLRIANCLERGATSLAGIARCVRRVEALEEYVSIWGRHRTIFSAGFRASVLLSQIADDSTTWGQDLGLRLRLGNVLDRLQYERPADLAPPVADQPDVLARALSRAAIRGSTEARRKLQPLWTILFEQRFRHRFEPAGVERRQLLRALRLSRLCIRARRAADVSVSDVAQWRWEAWVWVRFMVGRQALAGWQAHYNLACFYALLPNAADDGAPFGGPRLRRLALKHLARAIDKADTGALDCVYVRDQDPDLKVLRERCHADLERTVRGLCPDELVVHFPSLAADPSWRLHVWGPALAQSVQPEWSRPTVASATDGNEPVFRVRIFDENQRLAVLGHTPASKARPVWTFAPAAHMNEVWLYPSDPQVYPQPRPAS